LKLRRHAIAVRADNRAVGCGNRRVDCPPVHRDTAECNDWPTAFNRGPVDGVARLGVTLPGW
jgi:hypothetical protein